MSEEEQAMLGSEQLQSEKIKKKKKPGAKELLYDLWADKRSWKKRLAVSLLVAAAFTYTLFVYGPLEIYLRNVQYYTFFPKTLVIPVILVGLALFAGISLVLMLLRGKVFNCAVTLFFWAALGSYVQSFLPSNKLGPLDGSSIKWEKMTAHMFLNLLVWAGILLGLFVLLYFSKKNWRRTVTFVSVLLLVMQSAGFIPVIFKYDHENEATKGYLSNASAYEVSAKKNTIVFLIDRCGYSTLNMVFDKYPELAEGFKGFQSYDNALGSYSRTFPSVIYLLTGVKCDYKEPVTDYFKRAWEEGTFLRDIKNAGYNVKLYTEMNYVIRDTANIEGIVDNIGDDATEPKVCDILASQYGLSMYRYMPLTMKPFFWSYSGDIEKIGLSGKAKDVHTTDDASLFEGLVKKGLATDEDSNGAFIFYHMKGAHEPYTIDYDGNRVDRGDVFGQTGGDFKFVLKYIEMLKEKGIYDDTTIIITADHDFSGAYAELADSVSKGNAHNYRSIALLVKPAGADTEKPLETVNTPVTHDNIRSYILKSLGVDYSGCDAKPIDEIAPDDMTPRYFYMSGSNTLGIKRDYNLITYEIVGDVKDFNNWKKLSTERIKYPFYDAN